MAPSRIEPAMSGARGRESKLCDPENRYYLTDIGPGQDAANLGVGVETRLPRFSAFQKPELILLP